MESMTRDLQAGKELTESGIREATAAILDESISEESKANFLAALAQKEETAFEIAGFAGEFLNHAVEPTLDRDAIGKPLLDVCGTG